MNTKLSKEYLSQLISTSKSKAEVIRKLGFKGYEGGHYRTVNKYIQIYNLDVSHFLGQAWNVNGRFQPNPPPLLSSILVDNSTSTTHYLKKRLLQEKILEYKCSRCGISEWNNEPLSLQLDHINGKPTDNRLENLRLLCPNCHSQTPTYCRSKSAPSESRTRNNTVLSGTPLPVGIPTHKLICEECKEAFKSKNKDRKFCTTKCYHDSTHHRIGNRKVDRPNQDELNKLLETHSFVAVGKMYGVSDNAVRKWVK